VSDIDLEIGMLVVRWQASSLSDEEIARALRAAADDLDDDEDDDG
jgi:hypothetical protein